MGKYLFTQNVLKLALKVKIFCLFLLGFLLNIGQIIYYQPNGTADNFSKIVIPWFVLPLTILFLVRHKETLTSIKRLFKYYPAYTLILVFIVCFSLLLSPHLIYTLIGWITLIYLGFYAYICSREKVFSRLISTGFLTGLTLQCVIAIAQSIKQSSVGLHWLGEASISPTTFLVAKFYTSSGIWVRPYGLMEHANILAYMCLIGLLLLISQQWRRRTVELLPTMLASVFTITLALTVSRTAIIALTVFILGLVVTGFFKKLNRIAKATVVLAAVILSIPILWSGRVQIFGTEAATMRGDLFRKSLTAIQNKPLPGYGWQNFTSWLEMKYPSMELWDLQPVHNVWLLFWVQVGFWPVFITLLALIYLVRHFFTTDQPIKAWSLISILVSVSLFDHYLVTQPITVAALIILLSASET